MPNTINSLCFNWVVNFDPEKSSVQWDKSEEYVERINTVAQEVIALSPTLSRREVPAVKKFTEKLSVVNKCFEGVTHRSHFDQAIEALALTSSIFESELSPEVVQLLKSDHLNKILRNPENGSSLKSFLKELNVLLESGIQLTKKDIAILKKTTAKTFQIAEENPGHGIKWMADRAVQTLKFHIFTQSPAYQYLLNYEKGEALREPAAVAKQLEKLAQGISEVSENGFKLDQSEIMAIYANMQVIHEEFLGHSHLFTNALETMKEIPLVKKGIAQSFKKNLQALDLNSLHLRKDIEKLEKWIKELLPKNDPALKEWLQCFQELKKPAMLAPSQNELKLIAILKTKHKKLNEADYTECAENSVKGARKELLAYMKGCSSFENISGYLPRLATTTQEQRFGKFLEKHSVKSNKIVGRFPMLLKTFEAFSSRVARYYSTTWNSMKMLYDQKTDHHFSSIVASNLRLDMGESTEDFVDQLQDRFAEELKMRELDSGTLQDFEESLARNFKNVGDSIRNDFNEFYNEYYKGMHLWTAANYQFIEVSYNQEMHGDSNVNGGACFYNSFNRIKLIQEKPSIQGIRLPIGSTEKTRFDSAKDRMLDGLANYFGTNNSQRIAARSKEYSVDAANRYHVKGSTGREESANSAAELAGKLALSATGKNSNSNFLILLDSHAINVQIDVKNGMYRIFDDNGFYTITFPNLSSFKNALGSFLNDFYPENKTFTYFTFK